MMKEEKDEYLVSIPPEEIRGARFQPNTNIKWNQTYKRKAFKACPNCKSYTLYEPVDESAAFSVWCTTCGYKKWYQVALTAKDSDKIESLRSRKLRLKYEMNLHHEEITTIQSTLKSLVDKYNALKMQYEDADRTLASFDGRSKVYPRNYKPLEITEMTPDQISILLEKLGHGEAK